MKWFRYKGKIDVDRLDTNTKGNRVDPPAHVTFGADTSSVACRDRRARFVIVGLDGSLEDLFHSTTGQDLQVGVVHLIFECGGDGTEAPAPENRILVPRRIAQSGECVNAVALQSGISGVSFHRHGYRGEAIAEVQEPTGVVAVAVDHVPERRQSALMEGGIVRMSPHQRHDEFQGADPAHHRLCLPQTRQVGQGATSLGQELQLVLVHLQGLHYGQVSSRLKDGASVLLGMLAKFGELVQGSDVTGEIPVLVRSTQIFHQQLQNGGLVDQRWLGSPLWRRHLTQGRDDDLRHDGEWKVLYGMVLFRPCSSRTHRKRRGGSDRRGR